MGHRVSLDRMANIKISSTDAKQAQAIKFVTLLTEQCNYIAIYGIVQQHYVGFIALFSDSVFSTEFVFTKNVSFIYIQ